jgi:hypothetical protein
MKFLAAPAAALALLLTQCEPACEPDPASTDGPQFEQEQAASAVQPGSCESYAPLFEAYGLPVQTFMRIAWRESGCNHTSWVVDHDDLGGGLLGINFKTRQLRNGWANWCGAAPNNAFRFDPELQVRCAKAAYDRMGLRPWS